MMIFENVRLQLVDLPPISPEYTEPWVPQIIRNADAVALDRRTSATMTCWTGSKKREFFWKMPTSILNR